MAPAVHHQLPDREPAGHHQSRRPGSVRLQPQVLRVGPEQRHRIRPVLPELPQPPAADFRPAPALSRVWAMPSVRSIRWALRHRASPPGCPSTRRSPPPRNLGVARSAAAGGDLDLATATQYATIGANTHLAGGDVAAQAGNIATHEYALTAGYFTEYPEDIKLIGLSFNTQLQWSGIALQGEVAYRQDVPLQFDDVELLFAALTPFEQGLAALRGTPLPTTCPEGVPAASTLTHCGQLGGFGLDQVVSGLGPVRHLPGAVHGHQDLRGHPQCVADGAGRRGRSHPCRGHAGQAHGRAEWPRPALQRPGHQRQRQLRAAWPALPDDSGGGLPGAEPGRAAEPIRRCDFLRLPRRRATRVSGPHGAVERAAALQLAARRVGHHARTRAATSWKAAMASRWASRPTCMAKWEIDMSWTKFGGAGRFNDLNDRDFIAATLKYSF